MKSFLQVARMVTMFGQLGFTLITPPVVLALLAWWLQSRFGLGTWVILVDIVLGLLTSAASAYRFYLRVIGSEKKRARKEDAETDKPVVFYSHE